METIASSWQQLEGQEVHGRYPLHRCIAEADGKAIYETTYREQPAIIKLIRPHSSQTAFYLLAGIDAGKTLRHPNLIEIYDSGDTRVDGTRYVYAVMERADDNLGRVLRDRPLESDELRELLDGTLSVLDFIHAEGFVHTSLRPSNVLAVGDRLKISADSVHAVDQARGYAEAPGIYDAPETGAGVHLPASDIYSLAVLLAEAASGTPLESGRDKIPAPFDAIVRGGTARNAEQRWTTVQIRAVLNGEPPPAVKQSPAPATTGILFGSEPVPESSPSVHSLHDDEEKTVPAYRRYRGIAIGGALAAGIAVALLVQGARPTPRQLQPTANPAPAESTAVPSSAASPSQLPSADAVKPEPEPPAKPAPFGSSAASKGREWAVVAATYHREGDAEKRVKSLKKRHNSLHPRVVPAGEGRYFVVFGSGLNEQQAKSVEQRARKSGASRDAYVSLLE